MPRYTVRQGNCLSSIAREQGLFWETIWNHPENAELKEQRGDPNVLMPGDELFIPKRQPREEAAKTEQRHRFRLRGVPAILRLRLLDQGEPRVGEDYTLIIDGRYFEGTTNADGKLEQAIPPGAQEGRLFVGEDQDAFILHLGHLDPADGISGVQARLNNLGYDCGSVDGELNSTTRAALRRFQQEHELEETGEPNEATKDRLAEEHGS